MCFITVTLFPEIIAAVRWKMHSFFITITALTNLGSLLLINLLKLLYFVLAVLVSVLDARCLEAICLIQQTISPLFVQILSKPRDISIRAQEGMYFCCCNPLPSIKA
jgi:hypothetical protein